MFGYLAVKAYDTAKNPRFIIPPRKKLLLFLCLMFFVWTALLSVTVTQAVAIIITAPFLLYVSFTFFLLSRVWIVHKYHCLYLITASVLSFALAFLFKYLAYLF